MNYWVYFWLISSQIDSITNIVKESGKKEVQLEFDRIFKNLADRTMIEEQVKPPK